MLFDCLDTTAIRLIAVVELLSPWLIVFSARGAYSFCAFSARHGRSSPQPTWAHPAPYRRIAARARNGRSAYPSALAGK